MPRQPIAVVDLGDSGREQIEAAFAQPRHREFALDAAELGEGVGKDDAAAALGYTIGNDAVEEGGRVAAGDVELGEARQVQDADALAHRLAFLGHRIEPVGAPKPIAFLGAVGGIPFRPLPAEGLGEDGAALGELAVNRRRPHRSARLAEFAREVHLVHVVVLVERLRHAIGAALPVAKTPGVHLAYVDLGLAVDHPLGQVFSGAGTLGYSDAGAAAHPEVRQAGGRPDEESAVRGVGDGSADDALDAGVGERGYAPGRELEPRHQTVDVGRQQFGVERPVDAVERPSLGIRGLVGADDQALLLLAVITRRAGVTDDRRFPFQGRHLGHVVGHQILVDDVGDGNLEPDHGSDSGGETAGRIDHVLGDNRAVLGDHLPGSVGAPGDVDDPMAAVNLGAPGARAGGHGVGAAGRIGVPVAGCVSAKHHALGVQ